MNNALIQTPRRKLRTLASPNTPPPPNIAISIDEDALNNFLAAHYDADEDFYKRITTPIYHVDLPAHDPVAYPGEVDRTFDLFGKVTEKLRVELAPLQAPDPKKPEGRTGSTADFRKWWELRSGIKLAAGAKVPPNFLIRARVLLTLVFTNRTPPPNKHTLDYQFDVTAGAFLLLSTDTQGKTCLVARDWDVYINSLLVDGAGNPTKPPGERLPLPGGNLPSACDQALDDLRKKITDLFDFAANYAIRKLTTDLTTSLPLPPISNVVKAVDIVYDNLTIQNKAVTVSGWAHPAHKVDGVKGALDAAVAEVNKTFTAKFISELADEIQKLAAQGKQVDIENLMRAKVPRFAELQDRRRRGLKKTARRQHPASTKAAANSGLISITTDGTILDILAKKYLSVDKQACRSIFHVDVAVAYGDISVCYKVILQDARGGIDGDGNPNASCNVDVAAWGTATIAVRNPCGDDLSASYSLGLGLKGPLAAGLKIDSDSKPTTDDDNTNMLDVSGFCNDAPGFYIIGLPDIIGDLVNDILNAATSFLNEIFIDELLKSIHFYVVSIPLKVPGTHVAVDIRDFKSIRAPGSLTLQMSPRFKPE